MTTCLNFLNDLGQIIYYGNANDIFLRNTIILRPQKLIEIFNMVLNAKMPTWLENAKKQQQQQAIAPQTSQSLTPTSAGSKTSNQNNTNNQMAIISSSNNSQTQEWLELWEKFDQRGILHDRLLDVLWKNVINQKPGLLGLMKKFDLICERNITTATSTLINNGNTVNSGLAASFSSSSSSTRQFGSEHHLNREYLVPSRAKIAYDEYEVIAELIGQQQSVNNSNNNNGGRNRRRHDDDDDDEDDDNDDENDDSDNSDSYYDSPGHHHNADYGDDSGGEASSDGYFVGARNSTRAAKKNRILNNGLNVEFYYDFCGFLPGSYSFFYN